MTRRRLVPTLMRSALFIATMAAAGCVIVPMKLPTRLEESVGGRKMTLPMGAIVPGTTTREEIGQRFGAIAVDSGVPGLYWGRFQKSTWGLGFGTLLPAPYVGGGRVWRVANLLVTFDDHDRVRSFAVAREEELQARLAGAVAAVGAPPLRLSEALEVRDVSGRAARHDVVLTPTAITVTTTRYHSGTVERSVATVSLKLVERLQVGAGGEDLTGTEMQIRFSKRTEAGRKVALLVAPGSATAIVRWLAQARPDLLGPVPGEKPAKR